jgi:hypothetical protein
MIEAGRPVARRVMQPVAEAIMGALPLVLTTDCSGRALDLDNVPRRKALWSSLVGVFSRR